MPLACQSTPESFSTKKGLFRGVCCVRGPPPLGFVLALSWAGPMCSGRTQWACESPQPPTPRRTLKTYSIAGGKALSQAHGYEVGVGVRSQRRVKHRSASKTKWPKIIARKHTSLIFSVMSALVRFRCDLRNFV